MSWEWFISKGTDPRLWLGWHFPGDSSAPLRLNHCQVNLKTQVAEPVVTHSV
jgi:hypothetical protein